MDAENAKTAFQSLLAQGQSLYDNNDITGAIKLYKTALLMYKNVETYLIATAHIRLGNAYYKLDDRDKSTYYYEEYLKVYPAGQVSVFSRLAHAYYYMDIDKSIDYHNKALNMEINMYDSACKLFAMLKSPYYDQQDIKDEAEYEAEQIKNHLYKNIKKYDHSDKKNNSDRKLNVAYLSSDCRSHTMMNYMIPIWENHNREEFNFYIFNGSDVSDKTTERINNIGFEVINCSQMSNEEIAQAIYDRNIDILIDLNGYTHLKIYSLLFKPAPIIMSYLGYLNTYGMKEVDYIITDRYTIPEDKEYLYTEKPLYLDRGYQVFRGKDIPEISESPYKTNNYITFGSFNCSSKLNDVTFFIWAQILKSVSTSKLLIYRTRLTKNIIKHIKEKFEKYDISQERLIFETQKYTPHYKAYSLADIALDPYPFSGMSIAIETALMGVPTISMVGEGMQSRGAGRINNVLGLDDLNVCSGEDYVTKAVELAENKQRLNELRYGLRERVNNSDIRQSIVEFTKDLEDKYKKAWTNFLNSP